MGMTLQQVIAEFLEWATKARAAGTCIGYSRHFDSFLAKTGNVNVEELKPHHLLRWGETWHELQAIKRLFHWACEDADLVPKNPFRGVKLPPMGNRKRTITRKVLLQIMRAACHEFRNYLLALRETLARPQEVRDLRWEMLRPIGGVGDFRPGLVAGETAFVLDKYKAQERRSDPTKPRVILVSRRFGLLLERLLRGKKEPEGLVFLNTEGLPWTTNALRLQMKRIRERLGLTPDLRGEKIVCYTIRHTMATVATASGVKDRILAELMGHTSTRTTARYQHLDIGHLVDALGKVRL